MKFKNFKRSFDLKKSFLFYLFLALAPCIFLSACYHSADIDSASLEESSEIKITPVSTSDPLQEYLELPPGVLGDPINGEYYSISRCADLRKIGGRQGDEWQEVYQKCIYFVLQIMKEQREAAEE